MTGPFAVPQSPCPLGSGLWAPGVYVSEKAVKWEGTEKADEVGGLIGPWRALVGCTTRGKLLTRHVSVAVEGRLDCTWTRAKQRRGKRPVRPLVKNTLCRYVHKHTLSLTHTQTNTH